MKTFQDWLNIREQQMQAVQAAGVLKKTPGITGFDKTKKRIDQTLKGVFLKGNPKTASKQVDTIINGEINNAATGLEDAAKLAKMRDSIKQSLSS